MMAAEITEATQDLATLACRFVIVWDGNTDDPQVVEYGAPAQELIDAEITAEAYAARCAAEVEALIAAEIERRETAASPAVTVEAAAAVVELPLAGRVFGGDQ